MNINDIAGLPLEVSEYGAMGTPDEIDEMWYNAEHSYPAVTIKPFTGKNEPPLRPMERQHLPLGHPDRIPYEERMYQFFRNYRLDVERGRIACSNEEYRSVYTHEELYKAFLFESTDIFGKRVPISRKNFGYLWRYEFSKDEEIREQARIALIDGEVRA